MNSPSETNWEKFDSLTEEDIDTSDIPPLGKTKRYDYVNTEDRIEKNYR
jgi:hypothetical protein